MAADRNLWKTRTHNLSRMNLRELVPAYFSYPAIQTYIALAVINIALVFYFGGDLLRLALAVPLALLVYPFVWYLLHRFVLHAAQWSDRSLFFPRRYA